MVTGTYSQAHIHCIPPFCAQQAKVRNPGAVVFGQARVTARHAPRPCAPCPHRLWSPLRTLSPSLMVPLAHLVPIAYGTPCAPCPNRLWQPLAHLVPIAYGNPEAPCPHCLWYPLHTLSPTLMLPCAHLVPMASGTPCAPCPNGLWYPLGAFVHSARRACTRRAHCMGKLRIYATIGNILAFVDHTTAPQQPRVL